MIYVELHILEGNLTLLQTYFRIYALQSANAVMYSPVRVFFFNFYLSLFEQPAFKVTLYKLSSDPVTIFSTCEIYQYLLDISTVLVRIFSTREDH